MRKGGIFLSAVLLWVLLSGCEVRDSSGNGATIQEFIPQAPYAREDLPVIHLEKTVFYRSETILVSCENTDSGDMIFLYREKDSADPVCQSPVSGKTLRLQTDRLPAGIYIIELRDDDGIYVHDMALVRVCGEEDTADYTPVSAVFRTDEENGAWVDIQPASGVETEVEYQLCWSREGIPLPDHTAVCKISHKGNSSFTVALSQGICMPSGADGMTVEAMAGIPNRLPISVPEELAFPESEPVYRYNVLSDLHISPSLPRCGAMLKKAFRDIIAQGRSAVIFTVGDNTERGQKDEYQLLARIVSAAGEKLPNIYYTLGNHDILYNNDAGYHRQLALFRKQTGMPGAYYAVDISGYRHIVLGSDTLSPLGTVGKAQQDWLKAQLESADPDKPVFLYLHQPLKDTVSGTLYTKYDRSTEQDSFGFLADGNALREILKGYPNAIVFSGHTHRNFLSEQPVLLGMGQDANFVACSTVGKSDPGAEGLYVEVYENCVLLRGRDFAQNKWCGSMQIRIPVQ